MESGGAQEVASSMSEDNPIEEKRRGMKRGGAQAVSSSMTLRSGITLGRNNPNEKKRSGMERGGAQAVASSTAPRSRVAYGADGRPLDGVTRAELLDNLKHGDESIFRSNSYWAKVYRLYDTNETCLEPMMMTVPYDSCMPFWMVCKRHAYCNMLQIFSLKLAHTSYFGGPVHLYGYVAARDLLNPMRNYVFNRTRDDPFVVKHDGLIQMSGPKRGIRIHAPVLIEFDLKIKRGEEEDADLQLTDGVLPISDRVHGHARVNKQRIDSDCGSLDITFAVLECSSEATVQVGISEMEQDSGLSLCLVGSYFSPSFVLDGKIQLFDGVIAAEASEISRTVVAVPQDTKFVVTLKLSQTGGLDIHRCTIFPVQKHGSQIFIFSLGLATVEVKVTWSTMDIPESLLGPNCFKHEFWASRGVKYGVEFADE